MPGVIDKVFDDALALPSESRVLLVDRLLKSLNLPTDKETDALWVYEAERRVSQIEQGEVMLIPGDKVFAKIRKKYKK